jgi:hypothetical protein
MSRIGSGECQTKTERQDEPLDYARPKEPDGNRGFVGMVIGVVIGCASGLAMVSFACFVSYNFASYLREFVTSGGFSILAIAIIVLCAVAGGYVGRQIGLRR